MYGAGDALPDLYAERFRTAIYNERIDSTRTPGRDGSRERGDLLIQRPLVEISTHIVLMSSNGEIRPLRGRPYRGVWNKVVVVAREDDDESMLKHALIQSRRRYRS